MALDGDAVRGARLFGAGRALSAHGLDIGTLSPNTDYEDAMEREFGQRFRVALGDEGFEREYATGTLLSVSAATELALERPRPAAFENDGVATRIAATNSSVDSLR